MTDRVRIALTLAIALLLGASTYGRAFGISQFGVSSGILYGSGSRFIFFGLAIFGVFLVYRWWALLPAVVPTVVAIYLYATGDIPSGHEDVDLSSEPWYVTAWYVAWWTIGTILMAAFLSVGLLLRAVWESMRSRRRRDSLPHSA